MGSFDTNKSARPRIGTSGGELSRSNVKLPSIHELTSNSSIHGHGHSSISPRVPHGNIYHQGMGNDTLDRYRYPINPSTPGCYTGSESRGSIGPNLIETRINPINKILPTPATSYSDKPPQTQYRHYPSPPALSYPHHIVYPPQQAAYYPQYAPPIPTVSGSNPFVAPEVINKTNNVCQRCGTTETPEWRRGPGGVKTLCNACGLFHAKLVKRKGAALAAEEVLNNKVCKGKNGRRISIKKNFIDSDRLNSGFFPSPAAPANTTKNTTKHVGELPPPAASLVSPALIRH